MTIKLQIDATQRWNELETQDDNIRAERGPNDDLESYIEEYDNILQIHRNIEALSASRLDDLHKQEGIGNQNNPNRIRIKPIEITKFNGDSKNWNTFFETFKDAATRAVVRCGKDALLVR
jgi:hypothetical protein